MCIHISLVHGYTNPALLHFNNFCPPDGQIVEREKRVAFIGISNWALDPAKMNRGVMVTRGDPDVNELELSARGICSTKERDEVRNYLESYFRPLARAYYAICNKQTRQFFGLRDFYRYDNHLGLLFSFTTLTVSTA